MQFKQAKPLIAGLATIDFCDQPLSFRAARERFERAYFEDLLKITEGNVSEAARLSGIARQNFYNHIKRLAIVMKS